MPIKKHKSGYQALEALLTDDSDLSLEELKQDVIDAGIDADEFVAAFKGCLRKGEREAAPRAAKSTRLVQTKSRQGDKLLSVDFCRSFPIKEMVKRKWFHGFTGSSQDALADAQRLISAFLNNCIESPKAALLRQRVRDGANMNHHALLAWQCRVLMRAQALDVKRPFDVSVLNDNWLKGLTRLSAEKDGPARVEAYLAKAGIAFIVEPHLPSTHLDGAAMLSDRGPVIGITLRYDRIDNFWFVLLHEVVHVLRHLRAGQIEDIFDNLDLHGDGIEAEADEVAGDTLIPKNSWESCIARFTRSELSVKTFAAKLGISPAVVAGRIRNESKDWTILHNLVGQGEVRKHFTSVSFID